MCISGAAEGFTEQSEHMDKTWWRADNGQGESLNNLQLVARIGLNDCANQGILAARSYD